MGKKNEFRIPYIGLDQAPDFDLLYGLNGEFSLVISMVNPVLQYSGSAEAYHEFHSLFNNIVRIIGPGYLLQKQDVISKSLYPSIQASEYLQQKYNAHFAGRKALKVDTYLTLTRQVKKGRFYQYDPKALRDFKQILDKVMAILEAGGAKPKVLRENEVSTLIKRVLSLNFSDEVVSMDNIAPTDTQLNIGDKAARCISLIDIDCIDLPNQVTTHTELADNDTIRGFPVDLLSFLINVPDFHCVLYNQLLEIPEQAQTIRELNLKRKRHSGIPDPANNLCVADIDLLLNDVAKDNRLLVRAHFNILVCAANDQLQQACNFVESELFQLGITPGKNTYNQLELFRTCIPGNGVELKHYDWFLTTCDAALCFLYKESLPLDDPSDFLIRFTNRQGIPIAIDLSDLPMTQNRMSNRSRFVLGNSGTGKSFFMNAIVEQYLLYPMDVVIVDTGDSYSGLNRYKGGKYITWSDKSPITMNPFAITEAEYNIEKKDFLCTLIALLWKGAEGNISTVEHDVIAHLVAAYYANFFGAESSTSSEFKIVALNFNSFYEFALYRIPKLKEQEQIPFELEEFRFVLKKFYRGGEYQSILNEDADKSLFTAPFIVFEIDNIKESKILFSIVTLIIMDVFIQKMRHRSDRRKCLIVEEAWKAIASPLMANYLLFMYKTVRKFWGEVIVVTQELADIIGNPVVKDSIISNSGTVCLLDQSNFKDNYDQVAKLLSISEAERRKIFTINKLDNKADRGRFKEVYIRRGMTGEVYGVEVSLQQYLTYTTEKPEKNAVEKYADHYGSYPAGLDAFVADMERSGLPLGKFVTLINKTGKVYQSTLNSTTYA